MKVPGIPIPSAFHRKQTEIFVSQKWLSSSGQPLFIFYVRLIIFYFIIHPMLFLHLSYVSASILYDVPALPSSSSPCTFSDSNQTYS